MGNGKPIRPVFDLPDFDCILEEAEAEALPVSVARDMAADIAVSERELDKALAYLDRLERFFQQP